MGYTREEELGYGKWRHATTTRIRMGSKRTARSPPSTPPARSTPDPTRRATASLPGWATDSLIFTAVANARFVGKVAYTNSPVAGSYRGLGAPQAHFALESFADEVAESLRIDPLEFRLRHCVGPEGQPGERVTAIDSLVPAQPIEGGVPFLQQSLDANVSKKAPNESVGSRVPTVRANG